MTLRISWLGQGRRQTQNARFITPGCAEDCVAGLNSTPRRRDHLDGVEPARDRPGGLNSTPHCAVEPTSEMAQRMSPSVANGREQALCHASLVGTRHVRAVAVTVGGLHNAEPAAVDLRQPGPAADPAAGGAWSKMQVPLNIVLLPAQ